MLFDSDTNRLTIKTATRRLILLVALLASIVGDGRAAGEQDAAEDLVAVDSRFNETPGAEIDTSSWRCRFCPDNADQPWFLEVETGPGYVSNDSFKFGEYNGLEDKGLFLVLDVDARYRDGEANYLDISASDLGLDIRDVDIEGGKQGRYRINLLFDQIDHNELDTARTPYRGTSSQLLPDSWVAGSTTLAMTTLNSDLRDIDFSTRRRVLKLNSRVIQNEKWSYDVGVERQTRQGEVPFGAAIGTTFADARSAILAKPIDYVTERLELAANYRDNDGTGSISFVLSTFRNDNSSLEWENAFSVGSTSGQLAQEPDNQMWQIGASGQYRRFENVRLNGSLTFARLTQNEDFLPYTVNSVVATPPLPRSSLDGKVDVARANANALWMLDSGSRVKLSYEYFEHVDDTDRDTYTYVIADNALTGTPRANFSYDFRTQKFGAEASRRLERNDNLSGGLEYGVYDRTYQEVEHSTETRIWTRYAKSTSANVDYSVQLEGARRDADSYEAQAELIPPENPQLRKYNLADRDRIAASFNMDFTAGERWFVSLGLDQATADYTDSSVGLTESRDMSIGFDLQYLLSDEISLTAYLDHTEISSIQDGSSLAGDPDWSAENEDRIDTLGLGLSYIPREENFRLGIDYVHTVAIGKIDFDDVSVTPLPDLESELDNIEIYAELDYSENLTYRASYAYEVYEEKNWNLDGVTPSTIDNVLTLGETSPDYRIGVLWMTLKYRL